MKEYEEPKMDVITVVMGDVLTASGEPDEIGTELDWTKDNPWG